jgi:hypothetical protein
LSRIFGLGKWPGMALKVHHSLPAREKLHDGPRRLGWDGTRRLRLRGSHGGKCGCTDADRARFLPPRQQIATKSPAMDSLGNSSTMPHTCATGGRGFRD